ncbi:MAG TPA: hypothetical protein VGE52_05110, partial [Pirellulales bacterium]
AGLGTAFDTTLLALILSMFVKLPTSALQKSEEDLITSVDEYCNENFLRRLNDGRDGGAERGAGGSASVFREAVEAAMGTHHAELEKWLARLDAIGASLTHQMAESWNAVAARMQQQQEEHMSALLQQQVAQLSTLQQQQVEQQAALQRQQVETQNELREQLSSMAQSAGGIQAALADAAERAGALQQQANESYSAVQAGLQERFAGLEQGLNSLNGVLTRLGEQTVVIQQVSPPETNGAESHKKKGGWFGRFR